MYFTRVSTEYRSNAYVLCSLESVTIKWRIFFFGLIKNLLWIKWNRDVYVGSDTAFRTFPWLTPPEGLFIRSITFSNGKFILDMIDNIFGRDTPLTFWCQNLRMYKTVKSPWQLSWREGSCLIHLNLTSPEYMCCDGGNDSYGRRHTNSPSVQLEWCCTWWAVCFCKRKTNSNIN